MLLSVIIPAYNAEKYIANCLQTLMKQDMDMSDYEVIVINDGSTDGTLKIAEEWRQKHENIRVITTENRGQSCARNLGIEEAKGDYIHFVDADDYIAYGVYPVIAKYADSDNDVICFEYKEVGKITSDYYTNGLEFEETYENGIMFSLAHPVSDYIWLYWIKREYCIKERLRFIPGCFYEDGPFARALLNHCGPVVYLDLEVYRYTMNPTSTVHNRETRHRQKLTNSLLQVVRYMKDLYIQICRESDNERYIALIKDRISRYTFALQGRLIRSGGVQHCQRNYSGAGRGWTVSVQVRRKMEV